MNQKTINGVTISLMKENWMLTTYENNCVLNAALLEDLREIYNELNGTEDLSNLRLIQVFEGDIQITKDIGERYLTNRIRAKVGEAFVTNNPTTKQYLNGASAVMGTTHPVKVFDSLEKATEWLETL